MESAEEESSFPTRIKKKAIAPKRFNNETQLGIYDSLSSDVQFKSIHIENEKE